MLYSSIFYSINLMLISSSRPVGPGLLGTIFFYLFLKFHPFLNTIQIWNKMYQLISSKLKCFQKSLHELMKYL